MQIKTSLPDETKKIGRLVGERISRPFPILLIGDLGTGKTVFVKGLSEGVGISSHVKSPSFTILYTYDGGRFPIYHFDLYRLGKESIEDMFLEGYFDKDGIIVIEWADKLSNMDFFSSYLEINFIFLGENLRELSFSTQESYIKKIIEDVISEYTGN